MPKISLVNSKKTFVVNPYESFAAPLKLGDWNTIRVGFLIGTSNASNLLGAITTDHSVTPTDPSEYFMLGFTDLAAFPSKGANFMGAICRGRISSFTFDSTLNSVYDYSLVDVEGGAFFSNSTFDLNRVNLISSVPDNFSLGRSSGTGTEGTLLILEMKIKNKGLSNQKIDLNYFNYNYSNYGSVGISSTEEGLKSLILDTSSRIDLIDEKISYGERSWSLSSSPLNIPKFIFFNNPFGIAFHFYSICQIKLN